MAKKAIAEETIEVAPQEIVKAKTVKKEPKGPKWEVKDRHYYLIDIFPFNLHNVPAKTFKAQIKCFGLTRKNNEQRELRYATNQNSPFVDEQKGEANIRAYYVQKRAFICA